MLKLTGKRILRFTLPIFDLRVLLLSSSNGFFKMASQIAAAITTFLFNMTMMKLLVENGVVGVWIAVPLAELMTTIYN